MPPDPKVHVGVAAVVRNPTDPEQVLMIRRVGNTGFAADGHDTWSFPGGWLEHGESLGEAAVREVLEETGVNVIPKGQVGYVLCPSEVRDISIVTLFISCNWIMGEPRVTEPDKCADVGWMRWSDVQDGRPLFAPVKAWLLLDPLTKKMKEFPVDSPTLLLPCPDLRPHEPHDYTALGIDQGAHCDGVKEPLAEKHREDAAYNHPQHYGGADNLYEAIKVIMAWGLNFNLGNAVKYISRAGKKDPAKTIEDLKKARWYLDYEIRRLDQAGVDAALDIGG